MATRQSDEEKIIAWFTAADPEAAKVMFRVLKGLIASRGIDVGRKRKPTAKKSGKKTPTLTEVSSPTGSSAA